jgi:hypothetical protein
VNKSSLLQKDLLTNPDVVNYVGPLKKNKMAVDAVIKAVVPNAKCIRQFVLLVALLLKSLFNPVVTSRFIAVIVSSRVVNTKFQLKIGQPSFLIFLILNGRLIFYFKQYQMEVM